VITVGTKNEETRYKWVERKLAAVPAGWRILDAGAGEQAFKKFCSHLRYVSQDFAQYQPAALESGLQMPSWDYGKLDIVCDITAIPEPDASFDAILCLEVLEHVPDPRAVIVELSRLLRPGGRLIMSAPFCSLTHFAPYHYASGFNRYFYEKHLPENGLQVLELTANGNYFEYLAQEVRRLDAVTQRFASVPLGRIERWAQKILLKVLQTSSQRDTGSDELLAFGYQVVAEKAAVESSPPIAGGTRE
jgi:ubiquinone/menaquinone biosynthesis C-methylase UbiE